MMTKRNPWSDRDVERHWDRVADIYVRENEALRETHDQRFKKALQWFRLLPSSRVLNISSRDAGADAFIHAACPDASVVNAEISGGLIAVAKKLHPSAKQIKLDTYSRLPFEADTFHTILSLETLEHVPEPLVFLKELCRVSAAGARMVLCCPPAASEIPYRAYTFLFGGHGEGPHRFLSSRNVKALLRGSGWKLIHHEGTLLVPVGPKGLRDFGERVIQLFQKTFISELGIRQFYVCEKR